MPLHDSSGYILKLFILILTIPILFSLNRFGSINIINISNLFYIILILTLFWYFTPKSIVNNIPSILFLPVNKLALEHFLIDSAADIIVDSNIIDVVIYISSFIALMLTIRYYLF
jgi:hypothetical protein